jgi:hypothetical protein
VRWLFPTTDGPATVLSGPTVIGRGPDCTTVLQGAEISRNHAELYRNGPLTILRDMDSRNGSFVNGKRVREAALGQGDVVRLGEWIGVALQTSSTAPSEELAFGTIAPGLFGGPRLRAAVEPALRAAKSDLPIILEGETGTGKEVVARAIHGASGRAGRYLAVNCAALPETLAEGELFGYRRGAFTGADRANPGHFRAAHGGTLLLDEVCDLPLGLQAKILRVIEQREVLALGESQPVAIDTRIVAAAQGSLERSVAENTFRADLYARLDGLTVLSRRFVRASGWPDGAIAAAARAHRGCALSLRAPASRRKRRPSASRRSLVGRATVPLRLAAQRARADNARAPAAGVARA